MEKERVVGLEEQAAATVGSGPPWPPRREAGRLGGWAPVEAGRLRGRLGGREAVGEGREEIGRMGGWGAGPLTNLCASHGGQCTSTFLFCVRLSEFCHF